MSLEDMMVIGAMFLFGILWKIVCVFNFLTFNLYIVKDY